jgi:hypothetical protein
MLFDENEFKEILKDLDVFENEDYLLYGKRKEGKWIHNHQSLIDVHFCGYSNKMVKDFTFVKNDDEYWQLCHKIGFLGKWSEYVLSMVFNYNINKNTNIKGKNYDGFVKIKFPKSNFDRISSSGEWSDKWKDIPKICKLDIGGGHKPDPSKLVIFYLNMDYDCVEVDCVGNNGYYKNVILNKGSWFYEIVDRIDDMVFMSKITHENNTNVYIKKINNDNYHLITDRFIQR